MNVKQVPLDGLHQDPGNVRTHGTRNMEAIRESLARFGQVEPLVVQEQTGRVIGGNGRLEAMKQLGWEECKIVQLDLDDQQATALGIALNRTAELADWDEPGLATLLELLREEDALEGVGYTEEDLDELVQRLREQEEVDKDLDDEGPDEPPEVAVAKTGDLWILGDHLLLCGDSTSLKDVQRVMGGDKTRGLRWSRLGCADLLQAPLGRGLGPRTRFSVGTTRCPAVHDVAVRGLDRWFEPQPLSVDHAELPGDSLLERGEKLRIDAANVRAELLEVADLPRGDLTGLPDECDVPFDRGSFPGREAHDVAHFDTQDRLFAGAAHSSDLATRDGESEITDDRDHPIEALLGLFTRDGDVVDVDAQAAVETVNVLREAIEHRAIDEVGQDHARGRAMREMSV